MYIAVSNNHGWGKGDTVEAALKTAVAHSLNRQATVAAVWACGEKAYVDGMGYAYGVEGPRRRFERSGKGLRGTWKEVPDREPKEPAPLTIEDGSGYRSPPTLRERIKREG
jgi:hypothetical protein